MSFCDTLNLPAADGRAELEARMTAHAPSAGLTFLISLGADAVARELYCPPAFRKEERAS